MVKTQGPAALLGDFRLAEWLVQPSLNRISHGDTIVQLEPKQMDLLVFLAEHSGEVVSKDAIADAVWRQKYYSEWVITRAVAALRRAFGDDAREPRFIETISKRGYRLLANTNETRDTQLSTVVTRPTAGGERREPSYVVGQWVRGSSFYGRDPELAEILDGNRNCIWLQGTRMVGKTSMLRQLELIALEQPDRGYFPLYWSWQGAETPTELHEDFAAALTEADDRLGALGIARDEIDKSDLFLSLAALRRALRGRERTLLLLCDEVEELIRLKEQAPALLRKLRRALQAPDDLRCVLAASARLWSLADLKDDTSPFLHGFTPPLHLGPLRPEEARAVAEQSQLPRGSRPQLVSAVVDEICRECGRHPYLLQLLCRRVTEVGDLRRAAEEIGAEPTVGMLFAVDLETLSAHERCIVQALARGPLGRGQLAAALGGEPASLAGVLFSLERMGVLGRTSDNCYELANKLFARWLTARL
jgi:DNA-binding winged helix-turn-helix (wHTH) protein